MMPPLARCNSTRFSANICKHAQLNANLRELQTAAWPFALFCACSRSFALKYKAGCAVWAYFGLRRSTQPRVVIRPRLNRFLSTRGASPLAYLIGIELYGAA